MRVPAAIVAVILASSTPTGAVQPPPSSALPPASIALVVKYADGKARYDLVSERPAKFWTPEFPRIESWAAPAGTLPVIALQVARQLVGRDVRVDVAVHRGRGHQEEVPVATVTLSGARHVVVRELRAFGVEPIEIWLAEAAPMVPFLPTVVSVTPEVEISGVDLLSAPYPGYRITLRNLTTRPIANVHMQAYRGDEKAMSSVPRGPDGHPAMAPGGSFAFDINLTSGAAVGSGGWSPKPLDVIEIDSVLWEDGTIAGDPIYAPMRAAIAGDAGRRVQLARAVAVLRAAEQGIGSGDSLLARVRAGFEALPASDDTLLAAAEASLRATRLAVLNDLAAFARNGSTIHDSDSVRRWIRHTAERYEGWIRRLSP